jgi:hypothetical protein
MDERDHKAMNRPHTIYLSQQPGYRLFMEMGSFNGNTCTVSVQYNILGKTCVTDPEEVLTECLQEWYDAKVLALQEKPKEKPEKPCQCISKRDRVVCGFRCYE